MKTETLHQRIQVNTSGPHYRVPIEFKKKKYRTDREIQFKINLCATKYTKHTKKKKTDNKQNH